MAMLDSLLMAGNSLLTQIAPDISKSIYATLTVHINGYSLLRRLARSQVVPAGLLMGNELPLICSRATKVGSKVISIQLALTAASLVLSPLVARVMRRLGRGMEDGSISTLNAQVERRCGSRRPREVTLSR